MNICLSTGKEITFDLDYDSIEKGIERYEHFLNELIMESFHKSEKARKGFFVFVFIHFLNCKRQHTRKKHNAQKCHGYIHIHSSFFLIKK